MNNGLLIEAEKILQYNIGLFPVSSNLYNGIGEIQLKIKDTASARNSFQKAIELNCFDGNSRGMLLKLK